MLLNNSINLLQLMSPAKESFRLSTDLVVGTPKEHKGQNKSTSLSVLGEENGHHTKAPIRAVTPKPSSSHTAHGVDQELPTWTPLAAATNGEWDDEDGLNTRHVPMRKSSTLAASVRRDASSQRVAAYSATVTGISDDSDALPSPPVRPATARKPLLHGSTTLNPLITTLNGPISSTQPQILPQPRPLPQPLPASNKARNTKATSPSIRSNLPKRDRKRLVFDGVAGERLEQGVVAAPGIVQGQKRKRHSIDARDSGKELASVMGSAFRQNHAMMEDSDSPEEWDKDSKDGQGDPNSGLPGLPHPVSKRVRRTLRLVESETSLSDADASTKKRDVQGIDSKSVPDTAVGFLQEPHSSSVPEGLPTSVSAVSTNASIAEQSSDTEVPIAPNNDLASALRLVFSKNQSKATDLPTYIPPPPSQTIIRSRLMPLRKSTRRFPSLLAPHPESSVERVAPTGSKVFKPREVSELEFEKLLDVKEMPYRELGEVDHRLEDEDMEERVTMDIEVLLQDVNMDDDVKKGDEGCEGNLFGCRKVRFQPTPSQMWIERLEKMFGPGAADRGFSKKPRRTKARPLMSRSRSSGILTITGSIASPPDGAQQEVTAMKNPGTSMDSDEREGGIAVQVVLNQESAFEWAAAMQKLVKGKVMFDHEAIKRLRTVMDNIDLAKDNASLDLLKSSLLGQVMVQLSALDDVPFEDELQLQKCAKGVVSAGKRVAPFSLHSLPNPSEHFSTFPLIRRSKSTHRPLPVLRDPTMLALVHPVQHESIHSNPSPASSRSVSRQPSRRSHSNPSSSSSSSSVAPAASTSNRSLDVASLHPSSSHSNVVPPSTSSHPPASVTSSSSTHHRTDHPPRPSSEFDIHLYPSQDLLRLLASLLTQIAAANDNLPADPSFSDSFSSSSSHPTHLSLSEMQRRPIWRTLTEASRVALATPSSSLTFHARNIPTISLEAYLLRILKYCPTTNEVFLSLLVYFDRMARLANEATGKTFVIDSYNIHRLVIAGVTVASKFFSDVFYTNSRYAKVGGLPQAELNQLELQFLLLNDFRLMISEEEMQHYAEQLILFSQTHSLPSQSSTPLSTSSHAGLSSTVVPGGSSAPTQAMGAFDAYGGRVTDPHTHHRTHSHSYHNAEPHTPSVRPRRSTASFVDSETDTETDGASVDASLDGSTDDEPTIRPRHSSISSDAQSVYSSASEDTDADEGSRSRSVSASRRASLDGQHGAGMVYGDYHMASP